MFTTSSLLIGAWAAAMIGLSKSAFPGTGLLAIPLLAEVFVGRGIAGAMLPMLLVADILAVRWYGKNARFDIVRPLLGPLAVGYLLGTIFFVAVGSAARSLEISLGVIIAVLVMVQIYRMLRQAPPSKPQAMTIGFTGVMGGFTTFVANAAGPVLNTYFLALRLPKDEVIGTSAWFFFAVNASKIPIYLAIMTFAPGGAFFTMESLLYSATLSPIVVVAALIGRRLLTIISQRLFNGLVLLLSGIAALKLIVGG